MTARATLVTGAGGFLGAAVCAVLRDADHDVVAVVRPGGKPALDGTSRSCDLGNSVELRSLLDAVAPSAVVNCAAFVDFRPGTLQEHMPVNAVAPSVIADWAAANGAYFVQASMSGIHGASARYIGPTSPINCDTDYAKAKLIAEQSIAASGCRAAILRLGGIYGRRGPAHLGVNRAIDGAAGGQVPVVIGSGGARRNYIHVRDAAAVIAYCVKENLTGLYLCAGPEVLTIREMLEKVCARYLPGRDPVSKPGAEAIDQIVESSPALPSGLPMSEQLALDE